jgi:hypothetical protein
MISPSTGGVNPDRLHTRRRRAPRPRCDRPHVVVMPSFASLRRASGVGRPEGVPTPVFPGRPRSHPTHDLPGSSWESPAIKGNRRTRRGTAAEGVVGGTLGARASPVAHGWARCILPGVSHSVTANREICYCIPRRPPCTRSRSSLPQAPNPPADGSAEPASQEQRGSGGSGARSGSTATSGRSRERPHPGTRRIPVESAARTRAARTGLSAGRSPRSTPLPNPAAAIIDHDARFGGIARPPPPSKTASVGWSAPPGRLGPEGCPL